MFMERITTEPFPGDPDANRVVIAVGSRVRAYADLTKRIADDRFRSAEERSAVIATARQLRADLASRATSAGIVDHQMAEFFRAAARHAGVHLHPLPTRDEERERAGLKLDAETAARGKTADINLLRDLLETEKAKKRRQDKRVRDLTKQLAAAEQAL